MREAKVIRKFKKIDIIIDNPKSWVWNYIWKIRKLILNKYASIVDIYKTHNKIKKGEVLFILGCDRIINARILKKHRNNIVIHESNLPQGKGWSPIAWQVERGKNNIIFTLFEATRKVDAGDYYFKSILFLNGAELIGEIRRKVADKICDMIAYYLEHYPMSPKKQKGKATYFRKRKSDDYKLNINTSIKEQFNKLRVVDNERYPARFFYKNNKYILKIYKIRKVI